MDSMYGQTHRDTSSRASKLSTNKHHNAAIMCSHPSVLLVSRDDESHVQRSPGKHSRGAPLGRQFLILLNGAFWRSLLYTFQRRRPPRRRGVRGNLPPPLPLTSTGLLVSSRPLAAGLYDKATLAGFPSHLPSRLQSVIKAAARLIFSDFSSSKYHITPLVR